MTFREYRFAGMDGRRHRRRAELRWRGPFFGCASHHDKSGDGGWDLREVTFYVHSTHSVCLAAGFMAARRGWIDVVAWGGGGRRSRRLYHVPYYSSSTKVLLLLLLPTGAVAGGIAGSKQAQTSNKNE